MIRRTAYLAFAIQDLSTMGRKEGERVDCTRCGLRKLTTSLEARQVVAQWIADHVCDEEAAASPWVEP